MNKIFIIGSIIIVQFLFYSSMEPAIGCMDKSLHLTEKYDPKVFHYVNCNCPCAKYMAQCTHTMTLDRCPMCWHIHIPQTPIIVTKAVRQAAAQKVKQVSPIAFENADKTLAALFARRRK